MTAFLKGKIIVLILKRAYTQRLFLPFF